MSILLVFDFEDDRLLKNNLWILCEIGVFDDIIVEYLVIILEMNWKFEPVSFEDLVEEDGRILTSSCSEVSMFLVLLSLMLYVRPSDYSTNFHFHSTLR